MCVQNVPFKINEEGWKRSLERELDFYEGLGLSVGFVPLCAPKWVLFDKKSNRPETMKLKDAEYDFLAEFDSELLEFYTEKKGRKPLTVRCPFCGLVMIDVPNKDSYDYFCPECGWMA